MVKKVWILVCMVVAVGCLHAQVKRKIKKGRRNKAESQFMLDQNEFQAEWEIGYETVNSQLKTIVYPNLTLHYGLSDRFEVNTEISFLTARDLSAPLNKNLTGIEPVLIGANYMLIEETSKSPAVILSGQLGIPFLANKNFAADRYAPIFQVSVQQPVNKKIVIGLTPGLFWDGFSPTASFTYNGTLSYSFTKKWMLTTECFGFINQMPPQHNIDANIAYSLNDETQFGFTSGVGISQAAHKSYFAVNGTWGFKGQHKKDTSKGVL